MKSFIKEKGITLISLVVTIVILLILAGVTINNLINNGLVEKTDVATEETRKQIASEIMNLKITNIQMSSYVENKTLPNLQYLADNLCTDADIEYVVTTSKAIASLDKIDTTGCSSIFTKLKEYPYEFEINSSMQLASIDGVKIADVTQDGNTDTDDKEEVVEDEVEVIPFTWASGISKRGLYTDEPVVSIKKSGNVYVAYIEAGITLNANVKTVIGSFDPKFAPDTQMVVEGNIGASYQSIEIWIDTDGTVSIRSSANITSNGDWLSGEVVWIK